MIIYSQRTSLVIENLYAHFKKALHLGLSNWEKGAEIPLLLFMKKKIVWYEYQE